MLLHQAIHQAVETIGLDCLNNALPNIVADYAGYEDIPATKPVLKEFVSQGYGTKILELYQKKLPWQKRLQAFEAEFVAKTGFKDDLTHYVVECLEYGLGWIKTEPQYTPGSTTQPAQPSSDLSGVDLDKQLLLMQKEYISMLNTLIVVPEGKLYKKSGYYPSSAIAELWIVEHKIDIISAALGQDNTTWCKSEKEKVLNKYAQSAGKQFTAVLFKAIMPAITAVILLVQGIFYCLSISEIREYDELISAGDKFLIEQKYEDAITSYTNAANGYNGMFASTQKINNANAKVKEALRPLMRNALDKSKEYEAAGKYFDARNALSGLHAYNLDNEMTSTLKSAESHLEQSIALALVNGKNLMLQIISAKGRKMDASTIAVLDELLKVYPEDYWLNFVKRKTK